MSQLSAASRKHLTLTAASRLAISVLPSGRERSERRDRYPV